MPGMSIQKGYKEEKCFIISLNCFKMLLYYVPKKNPLRYLVPFSILELQHMCSISIVGDK